MKVKTGATAPLRWGRRGLHAARSLSPTALIAATAVLVFGGVGVAGAATGGNFILGKLNTETSQSYINNSTGVPLKLTAPANFPPLKVSNSNLVSGLNSQYLSGFSAQQLATGGDGFTTPATDTPLTTTLKEVASTGSLPAGTYYVNATALLWLASGDNVGFCNITKGSGALVAYGGAETVGWGQTASTAAVNVNAETPCRSGAIPAVTMVLSPTTPGSPPSGFFPPAEPPRPVGISRLPSPAGRHPRAGSR